ncbi:uncharacterized protein [Procambarus clarkii]|uniref:uncharacterized protein n=1 Tax=Procambarus clarkii TaxID=6728 RepID=UPI0037443DF7
MLDLKECTNYDAVKKAVLHSFKLTSECYRKRFRECTRSPGKSYAETARDMERKFLKWLESEGAKSAEDVKRLMVMVKFMSMLSPEIRIRVKEADIKDLRAAADRADMLEEAMRPRRKGPHRPPVYSGYGGSYRKMDGWRTGTSSPKSHLSSGDGRGSKSSAEPAKKPLAESAGVVAVTRDAAKETTEGARKTHGATASGGVARLSGGGRSPPRRARCYNCGGLGYISRECRRPKQRGNVAFVRVEDQEAERVRDEPVPNSSGRGLCLDAQDGGASHPVILGNDACGGCVLPNLVKSEECLEHYKEKGGVLDACGNEKEIAEVAFPVCAVIPRRCNEHEVNGSDGAEEESSDSLGVDHLFVEPGGQVEGDGSPDGELRVTLASSLGVDRTRLGELQQVEFPDLIQEAKGGRVGPERASHFYMQDRMLMRQWRPVRMEAGEESLGTRHQVVLPTQCRATVLDMSHSVDSAGHLGVTKTLHKIRDHFYWPGMDTDVRRYCKTCLPCQRAGKSQPAIPRAPLVPVPAFGSAFERLLVDGVRPLPRTKKGNTYLMTIMCASTKFPEAVPIPEATVDVEKCSRTVTTFFLLGGNAQGNLHGLWKCIPVQMVQTDRDKLGSDSDSVVALSTAVARGDRKVHSTLKTILRVFCEKQGTEWDE